MKIALIGPTAIDVISTHSGIPEEVYVSSARKAGELIAQYNHDLIIVPDRGIAVEGMHAYRKNNGRKIMGIAPSGWESYYQKETLKINQHICYCDEVITNLGWNEQHSYICEIADLMICCGISCGTVCEIAWTKWHQKPTVYLCKNTISGNYSEIMAEAKVIMLDDINDFESVLKNAT